MLKNSSLLIIIPDNECEHASFLVNMEYPSLLMFPVSFHGA